VKKSLAKTAILCGGLGPRVEVPVTRNRESSREVPIVDEKGTEAETSGETRKKKNKRGKGVVHTKIKEEGVGVRKTVGECRD